jgi:prepilin-type N-terminal cleavage/methylation domain-containing protein
MKPAAKATRARQRGFTIMEVIVAIMLLAVAVVSIFGAQFAAIATTEFARYSTHAIQLARCKMSELELETLTENGFESTDVVERGDCCELLEGEPFSETDSIDNVFTCTWELKVVDIPDLTSIMTGGGPDGGLGPDLFGDGAGGADGLGALGAMTGMGGDRTGGMDDMGLMGMISGFAPMITDMLREGIRRATVKVEWDQGSRHREFVLSQYLVHPTQGPLQLLNAAATAEQAAEEAAAAGDAPPSAVFSGGGN